MGFVLMGLLKSQTHLTKNRKNQR